jgi:hypothetical protein
MTGAHNRFSNYRLFAGGDHAAGRLYAGLAEAHWPERSGTALASRTAIARMVALIAIRAKV